MRRTLVLFPILALVTATVVAAKDDKLSAPPPGLTPTSVTVSQILKQYDAAVGTLKAGVTDARRETWHFTQAGLHGTETLTRQEYNFHSKIVSGPIVDEYGQFLGQRWHKDANGFVTPVQGIDATSFEMLIFMRNFGDTEDPKNDVKVVGESADPQPSYVVQINRPDYKHPEWVFYDKKTGLVDQIVNVVSDKKFTATYTDYRPTKGLTQPWHVHVTDGRAPLDDDFVRDSLAIGVTPDPREFTMPTSSSSLMTVTGHTELPAHVVTRQLYMDSGIRSYRTFTAPTVVLRVNVNGRGLDFELTSGTPDSLIDWDVAQQLGLSAYGQALRTPSGEPMAYDTILPSASIGPITLHNFAVRALPFNYHLGGEIEVVGTLGYDILKSGVFKIDYDNGKVLLDPASAFEVPMPVVGAFMLPLHFDQGYPFFDGLLDMHQSQSLLLANNFDLSYVLGHFTSQYPDAVKDTNGQHHGGAVVPFADSSSYGKELDVWLGRLGDLQVGPAHFVDYDMLGTDGDVEFAGHQVDAVIGADFLKYYDVYLDFPHNRVFLKPNKAFYDAFRV
jgi:hypothetical protein